MASAARELLNKTDNERSGVVSTAMTLLGLYRDPIVARMTSGSDWRIADLLGAGRPVSLYLVVPPSEGLERPAVVTLLFLMTLALAASALLLGIGADRLNRRGVSLPATLAAAAATAILAQLALVLRWPLPLWLPWLLIAATGAGTVLSYAILSGMFPKSVLGRANSALNLVHVTAAFAIQYAVGHTVRNTDT